MSGNENELSPTERRIAAEEETSSQYNTDDETETSESQSDQPEGLGGAGAPPMGPGTSYDPEPEPEPEPEPTPEPEQPTRGRGDSSSGPSSTAPGDDSQTEQGVPPDPSNGPEPVPDELDGSDSSETDTESNPEPEQPARGRGDESSGPESVGPPPEPEQEARGRDDTGSGPSSTAPEEPPQPIDQQPQPPGETTAPTTDDTPSLEDLPTAEELENQGDSGVVGQETVKPDNETQTGPTRDDLEDAFEETQSGVVEGVAGAAQGAADATQEGVETAVEQAEDAPQTVADFTGDTYSTATDLVGEGYGVATEAAADTQTLQNIDNTISAIAAAEEEAGEPITGPQGEIEQALGEKADILSKKSGKAADWTLENLVKPGSTSIGAAFETAGTLGEGDQAPDADSDVIQNVLMGAGKELTSLTVGLGETGVKGGQSAKQAAETTVENVETEGAAEGIGKTGETAAEVAGEAGAATFQAAQENPAQLAGQLGAGAFIGLASGKALGKLGRVSRDRLRTLGGEEIDLEDLTQKAVREGDEDFPGAQDPDLYESDPAEAVRRQAEDMTPEELSKQFDQANVGEGVTLKKAVETEPEGPKTSRAAQGLDVPEGGYESPGGFAGPELSPNFLRIGGEAELSLRPGLPRMGGKPTAAAIKTRVRRSDADTLEEFNEQLREEAGETDALTKPASEVNTGEIEAVIPPGAQFADVGTGPIRDVLRRAGVGADAFTTVEGRRVPIRTVAPEDSLSGGGSKTLSDLLSDTRGQLGGDTGGSRVTRSADELVRRGETPVDRPLPTVPSASGTTATTTQTTPSAETTPTTDTTPSGASGSTTTTTSPLDTVLSGIGSSVDQATTDLETSVNDSIDTLSERLDSALGGLTGGVGTTPPETTQPEDGTQSPTETTPSSSSPTDTTETMPPETPPIETTPPGSGGPTEPPSDGPTTTPPETPPPTTEPPTSGPTETPPFDPPGTTPPSTPPGESTPPAPPITEPPASTGVSLPPIDPPEKPPRIDFGDDTKKKRRDDDIDPSILADLFENPAVSPSEALDFDPLGE